MLQKTIDSIFIIIQGSSSFILAVLTFFYLREVSKTRKMTSKVLELEWTTDLGLDLAASHYVLDPNSKKIHVPYTLTISSVGKLPVDLLGGQLVISVGEETTMHEIRAVNKLGSSTTQSFTLSFARTDAEINRLNALSDNTIMEWDSSLPTISAEIKLAYKDGLTEKKCEKIFRYKYEFNNWKNI